MSTRKDYEPATGRSATGRRPAPLDDFRSPAYRAAALAGAATLPLMVIGVTLSDPFTYRDDVHPGASDAALLDYLSVARTELQWASALESLAAVSLWVFLGPLWARVRRGSEWLAVVAVAGGAVAGLMLLLGAEWSLVMAVAADHQDVEAARFLVVEGWESARLAVAPALVMVGATMLAGIRGRVFGAGVNTFSGIFAALLLLGLVPAAPAGMVGMASNVWVFVVALVLAFKPPSGVMVPDAPTPRAP